MKKLKAYDVEYAGLKEGVHIYDYHINDDFLEMLPSEDLIAVDVYVKLNLEKQSQMLILEFDINGKLGVCCDRCLEAFNHQIKSLEKLFVKFGSQACEETDEIVVLSFNEYKLNIAQYIYEYLHLLLPIKRIHENDANGVSLCNPEMLARISEVEIKMPENSVWDALKKFKNI